MAIVRRDSDGRRRARPGDPSRGRQWEFFAGHGDGASSSPSVCLARQGSRRDFVRARCSIRFTARGLSLILLSAVAMSVPFVRQAVAQQIPSNPPNGTVVDLVGDSTQLETVSLANGATLTVNGNGNTLTLNNGAFFQFPSNANTASQAGSLAFGDATTQEITVQSGSRSTGGAIFGDNTGQAGASIPIQGTATSLNNVATASTNGVGGGAVGFPNLSGGTLTIGSPGSTVFFTTNSAAVSNGCSAARF
jgi:hypothetical protein